MPPFVLYLLFVQSVGFTHSSFEPVAVNGVFEECFWCDDQHSCLLVRRLMYIGHPKWPYNHFLSFTEKVFHTYLSGQTLTFTKGGQDSV